MKYIKSFLFFVMAAALTLAGCNDQDDLQDRVDALGNRVTALEEQVKILNENLETLGTLLNMENMKTIKDVQADNGQYTITLSDNTVLSLTIGVQGTAQEPEITIEDGEWVVNGKPTGVSAVGQAGANGSGYPEFRVNDGKWQVRFLAADGTVTEDWQNVGGDANTDIGEIGDQIIAGVEVTDTQLTITYYTAYSEGTTKTISLPIVPDLTCEIVTAEQLDDEGYLLMEAGTVQTLEVKIKGGTPQLTYPSEWRATIESTDTEGVYELAIYAPADDASAASAGSRVSANNMEDVTVRVQKGTYWAVDKVKVKIGSSEPVVPVEKTPYEKYEAGETITIGSYEFDKEDGLTATHVTSNTDVSETTIADKTVYFIEPGATLTFSSGKVTNVNTVIFVSAKEGERAEVKTSVSSNVFFRAGGTTNFIAKDINFSPSANATHFMDLNADSKIENFIFEGCKVSVNAPNHLLYGGATAATDNAAENIELLNNDVAFNATADWQGSRILNFQGKKSSADITVTGNVFYSTNGEYNVNGTVLTTNDEDCTGDILIKDNTFINYLVASQQMVRGLMSADTNITIQNCLFYSNYKKTTEATTTGSDGTENTRDTSNNSLINNNGGTPAQPVVTEDDVKFYNRGDGTVTFRLWSSVPTGMSQITFTALSTPPLTDIDYANGTFTKASGYENCGATR